MLLGKTKQDTDNIGNIKNYKKPYSREEQIDIMKERHHIKVENTKSAKLILQKVPYNLLIYPTQKVWYSKSPNGKVFMKDTTIEELYELYKFDSFLKGKVLELVRSFENMFLGSLAYHFEFEYKDISEKMGPNLKIKIPKHNVGYIKTNTNTNITNYQILPLWEQFFSENSTITMNEEINLWKTLYSDKFLNLKLNTNEIYADKQNAKRFASDELTFIKSNFKPATVRKQCIQDVIRFAACKQEKWKRDIGDSNFTDFLDIIRNFRNSASHPGYILNKTAKWPPAQRTSSKNKKFNNTIIDFKGFISILPYFLPQDLIDDFFLSIKKRLIVMNFKNDVSLSHIERIENYIGIAIKE